MCHHLDRATSPAERLQREETKTGLGGSDLRNLGGSNYNCFPNMHLRSVRHRTFGSGALANADALPSTIGTRLGMATPTCSLHRKATSGICSTSTASRSRRSLQTRASTLPACLHAPCCCISSIRCRLSRSTNVCGTAAQSLSGNIPDLASVLRLSACTEPVHFQITGQQPAKVSS